MKNLILAISGLSVAVLLAACGGGGDGTADPAAATSSTTAAKYGGTWGGCFSTGAASSRKETLVITPQGADIASFSFAETSYGQLACAGAAGTTSTDTGTVAFSGTKTIGTETVDKGIVTQAGGSQKQVFLATATTLQFGRQAGDGGTPDADGYPTTFDTNPLARQ